MKYLVGVDGGGTKTLGALAELNGNVIKTHTTGPSNYHSVGLEEVEKNLHELIEKLLNGNLTDVRFCYLGLAGVGRPVDFEKVGAILQKISIKDKSYLTNDAMIALMGGALADTGIIVIAGTGSIILGKDKTGQTLRAGGWGQFLADEGSGYRLGLNGLRTIMRAYDKRGPQTQLSQAILSHLSLANAPELVTWLSGLDSIKDDVSKLAPFVLQAAEENDEPARQIVDNAVAEILEGVETVYKNGHFPTGKTSVILAGGVVQHSDFYFNMVKRKIEEAIPGIEVSRPRAPAVVGALIGAASQAGIQISEQFLSQLLTSWQKITPTP